MTRSYPRSTDPTVNRPELIREIKRRRRAGADKETLETVVVLYQRWRSLDPQARGPVGCEVFIERGLAKLEAEAGGR